MSPSLQPKYTPSMSTHTQSQQQAKRREISLSLGNLVAMWGVTAALMVVVFFLGLHAGMEQGLNTLLEEQSSAAVRLPVMPLEGSVQLASAGSPSIGGEGIAKGDLSAARGLFAADGVGVSHIKPASSPAEEQFDFSQSSVAEGSVAQVSPAGQMGALRQGSSDPAVASSAESASGIRTSSDTPSIGEPLSLELEGPQRAVKPTERSTVSAPTGSATVKPSSLSSPPVAAAEPVKVVAKVMEPKKIAEPKLQEQVKSSRVSKGFYVQVAAPRSRGDAELAAKRLLRTGIPAQIQETRVGKLSYFRVIAGPRKTRKEAELLRGKLVKSGSKESFVKFLGE